MGSILDVAERSAATEIDLRMCLRTNTFGTADQVSEVEGRITFTTSPGSIACRDFISTTTDFDELLVWVEAVKPNVPEIDSLVFAELARTGSGEGDDPRRLPKRVGFLGCPRTVAELFDDMAGYLKDRPHHRRRLV